MAQAGEEGRIYPEALEELTGWDGWKGYEFWSSQLEAREGLAEYGGKVGGKARFAESAGSQREGLSDAFPF